MTTHQAPTIPLPKAWNQHVKAAVLHVVSLAQYAKSHTRGWAANGINPRVRQQAEFDRANLEIAYEEMFRKWQENEPPSEMNVVKK